MKNIEIKTTQNVVLQYELADLRDRIIAFLIDALCMGIGVLLLSLIGSGISSPTAQSVYNLLLFSFFTFYSLVFEVFNHGQSLGKMAMRIQVIKTAGGHATFSDYAARWVFRMVDIYSSLGTIACILIASSTKSQRIGDIVANTAVVRLIPKLDLSLKDILTIHSKDSYKPVYMQARQLQEEDVLLIKSTLDRYKKFRNDAHSEAVMLLANRIKVILGIAEIEGSTINFLTTVLNDYVVLTR